MILSYAGKILPPANFGFVLSASEIILEARLTNFILLEYRFFVKCLLKLRARERESERARERESERARERESERARERESARARERESARARERASARARERESERARE